MIYSEKSLKYILAEYGIERTQKVLSSFICDNTDVHDFINNRAITHEQRGLSKSISNNSLSSGNTGLASEVKYVPFS